MQEDVKGHVHSQQTRPQAFCVSLIPTPNKTSSAMASAAADTADSGWESIYEELQDTAKGREVEPCLCVFLCLRAKYSWRVFCLWLVALPGMAPGRFLHAPEFSLRRSLTAIELMVPKMDPGNQLSRLVCSRQFGDPSVSHLHPFKHSSSFHPLPPVHHPALHNHEKPSLEHAIKSGSLPLDPTAEQIIAILVSSFPSLHSLSLSLSLGMFDSLAAPPSLPFSHSPVSTHIL